METTTVFKCPYLNHHRALDGGMKNNDIFRMKGFFNGNLKVNSLDAGKKKYIKANLSMSKNISYILMNYQCMKPLKQI